ncbi:3-oxoacyl-[acyl-carrier protein] reductase [Hydrogenispora ethanolica]|uniref:3-oxoacyl-[acyl-carrier protein] reductase n=1 Tax=Hydrogenispora ethanolica TaxID=1082276 RepID=A0A4V2QEZ3_HYDET|nr:3-oxoacyl-[acyl-carrier protein] reductase [Hydrogenispora ethanolica]
MHQKRVLVTGSSRGIGLAIAKEFLAEGARVVLTSRHQSDLDRLHRNLSQAYIGSELLALACDFTDSDSILGLKNKIVTSWSGLDILVVNVGSGESVAEPLPPAAHFKRVVRVNFDSAVDTVREFFPLLQTTRGNILFIASIAGLEAFGAPVDYAAAKSALIAFAKNLARKVGGMGVRVNCIAPGNIYFQGGSWAGKVKADPERVQTMLQMNVPLQRFGRPEEIAVAAVFLASERSSFTTGACLVIDGGQTVGI